MIDHSPPKIWTPPKPAIIRAADADLVRDWKRADARRVQQEQRSTFPFPTFCPGNTIQSTFIDQYQSTADLTTYTFSSIVIPRAGMVIIAAAGRDNSTNRTISSVGFNGTITNTIGASGNRNPIAIGYIYQAAGTYNLTVTFGGQTPRCSAAVWLLENYVSATPISAVATSAGDSTVTSRSATLDFNNNSIGFYFTMGTVSSWSAATEDDRGVASNTFVCARKIMPTAASGNVETATYTGSTIATICGASWN
jgi:hypothetical protein